jgi:tetratricopeptide (TPR) repeat protein
MKHLGRRGLRSSETVSPQFRRLWFLAAIAGLQYAGRLGTADAYLENARLLLPHDPDVLLLSGIAEEMRGSNRAVTPSAAERRTALGYAEVYLRSSLEYAPDRLEAQLRLGRVLYQRGHPAEARDLLTGLSQAQDVRLSYLAALFLGGLEDAAGRTADAAQWYARAAARMPSGQAAQLASSELRHRAGERQQAADAIPFAIGPKNSADPWWGYLFGEYWRIDLYLDALRKMSRS